MTNQYNRPIVENAVAISAELHTHKDYHRFYDLVGSHLGGFTGIYDLCIDMAQVLAAYELKHGGSPSCWESTHHGKDWIETVEVYVNHVISYALKGNGLPLLGAAFTSSVEA